MINMMMLFMVFVSLGGMRLSVLDISLLNCCGFICIVIWLVCWCGFGGVRWCGFW